MSRLVHVGFFENPRDLLSAARECREKGVSILDARTPFPIHGIDEVLGIERSRLGVVCLAGGAAGLFLGLLLQYWTSAVNWPVNVGGKPLDSLPAFVPVAFEIMILCAGLVTAAAFLVRSRLRPGRKEPLVLERVTDDRFALVVLERDASLPSDEYAALWRRHGAVDSLVSRIGS
jgi:hypothetical protein